MSEWCEDHVILISRAVVSLLLPMRNRVPISSFPFSPPQIAERHHHETSPSSSGSKVTLGPTDQNPAPRTMRRQILLDPAASFEKAAREVLSFQYSSSVCRIAHSSRSFHTLVFLLHSAHTL